MKYFIVILVSLILLLYCSCEKESFEENQSTKLIPSEVNYNIIPYYEPDNLELR